MSVVRLEEVACKDGKRYSEHVNAAKEDKLSVEALGTLRDRVLGLQEEIKIVSEDPELEPDEDKALYACVIMVLMLSIEVDVSHCCED